jgi:nucleotide-binding universal stress UspA family protein
MADRALESIVFPTDFAEASEEAFAHALRIGVAARALLHLLHIGGRDEGPDWTRFPHVRETLIKWGMLGEGASQSAVAEKLGLRIDKACVDAHDPVKGIVSYLETNSCDLLVLAPHARAGLRGSIQGSVATESARRAHVPTLFLRKGQKGFIDRDTGAASLRRVLIPIGANISPAPAWRLTSAVAGLLNPSYESRLLHVGEHAPSLGDALASVDVRRGPVVETIVCFAREIDADLIAMPTAGRLGLFDALLGSTTERVIHHADQPVLAIPAQAEL